MTCNCNQFNPLSRRDFLGRFALGLGGAALAGLFERGRPVVVAGGPFTEQHVLNELLARRLRDAGFRPDQRPRIERPDHGLIDLQQFMHPSNIIAACKSKSAPRSRQSAKREGKSVPAGPRRHSSNECEFSGGSSPT